MMNERNTIEQMMNKRNTIEQMMNKKQQKLMSIKEQVENLN